VLNVCQDLNHDKNQETVAMLQALFKFKLPDLANVTRLSIEQKCQCISYQRHTRSARSFFAYSPNSLTDFVSCPASHVCQLTRVGFSMKFEDRINRSLTDSVPNGFSRFSGRGENQCSNSQGCLKELETIDNRDGG
jgi:hypothetical protein